MIHEVDQSTGRTAVLVVGAGPVGLVVAADLVRQGVTVRVVDASTTDSPQSRAIVIWPRTLEILRRLAVVERLCDLGHRLDSVSFYSDRRRLGAVDICRLPDTPYPFALTIPQNTTEHVLRDRLVELGGTVERGVRLVGLSNDGSRPVATLAHPDGSHEQLGAEWVIGADGSRSTVREQLGIGFPPDGGEVLFAIGDAPVSGQRREELVYSYRRDGALGVAPLADGGFRIAFSVPQWPEGETPPRELFQQMVDRLAPSPGEVGELRWSTVFRAQRRTAPTFRQGRGFLAGDAAHVFSAAGAQGMNTGIQDAVSLAWRLGGVVRGVLDPSVLNAYSDERRSSVARVSLNTQRQTEWGLLKARTAIVLRNLLVRTASRLGILQRYGAPLISQTDVDYGAQRPSWPRWRRRRVRAGMRLPVFVRGSGRDDPATLWPAMEPDAFAVLLWSGRWARNHDWLRRCAAIRTLGDIEPDAVTVQEISGSEALRRRLGRRATAVVVRPDGHVAALLDEPEPDHVEHALRRAGVRLRSRLASSADMAEVADMLGGRP